MTGILERWTKPPLIGVIHAPPLPGSPRYGNDWQLVRARVLQDAQVYQEGGVDAILLENFGDAPFFPAEVPQVTVAHMTALALMLREQSELPIGVNVLRNDGAAACAVALAADAQFIRVNVFCGARITDQGIVNGIAHDLLRVRHSWNAEHIRVLADVDVKHSAPLAARDIGDEVEETFDRGGADAIVVTGRATGSAVDLDQLRQAKQAAGNRPVFVGSGVTPENVESLMEYADGLIVGSALKRDGQIANEVDAARVSALRRAIDRSLAL